MSDEGGRGGGGRGDRSGLRERTRKGEALWKQNKQASVTDVSSEVQEEKAVGSYVVQGEKKRSTAALRPPLRASTYSVSTITSCAILITSSNPSSTGLLLSSLAPAL